MGGKTSAASKNKYNSKAYDRIEITPIKGGKAEIKAAADRAGQSVNAYILQAVQQRMTADGNSTDNGGKL